LMWKANGDASEAMKHFDKAIEIFEKLKLDKGLSEAKAARNAVETEPNENS
jgi:hypothetical protein